VPDEEEAEVARIFRDYGLPEDSVQAAVRAVCSDRRRWVDFMMRFELGLEEPDPGRARASALTIALSYVAGGLVPLAPYFFLGSVHTGLLVSVAVTLLALLAFGYVSGQGTLHHAPALAQRLANGDRGWARGFRGVRNCSADWRGG
jgi:VIT1/CCC1 family predicted Fe2+/Mn2+ transporter